MSHLRLVGDDTKKTSNFDTDLLLKYVGLIEKICAETEPCDDGTKNAHTLMLDLHEYVHKVVNGEETAADLSEDIHKTVRSLEWILMNVSEFSERILKTLETIEEDISKPREANQNEP